jgi:hypothetical protein
MTRAGALIRLPLKSRPLACPVIATYLALEFDQRYRLVAMSSQLTKAIVRSP